MANCTILYVEDDETLAFLTKDSLEMNNYNVLHCRTAEEALSLFKKNKIDLCVLDIMLPAKDGFELAASIREINQEVPIIFLSAKTLREDRIKGLKTGADDYIVKPFSIEELILKIEIFLQRPRKNTRNTKVYQAGSLVFDAGNYTVQVGEEKKLLTQRQSELLQFLFENKNKVLGREQILTSIWGKNDYFLGRSLDVFISKLRKILSQEPGVQIENLHGIGFKFTVAE
jgi:DNA-binding response OmpR family regulator